MAKTCRSEGGGTGSGVPVNPARSLFWWAWDSITPPLSASKTWHRRGFSFIVRILSIQDPLVLN